MTAIAGTWGGTTSHDLVALRREVAELHATLEEQRRRRAALDDLLHDLGPTAKEVMTTATTLLAEADTRGYAEFARSAARLVDRVVTSFSASDVDALADNIVLILTTVKDMTQADIMALAQRTAAEVHEPSHDWSDPPSLIGLLRQLHDPQVRRGLARLLGVVGVMGAPDASEPTTQPTQEVQH